MDAPSPPSEQPKAVARHASDGGDVLRLIGDELPPQPAVDAEVNIMVRLDRERDRVGIVLSRPVPLLILDPDSAIVLGQQLLKAARKLRRR